METTKKMTKKEYFAILREAYPQTAPNYAEVIAFIDHEVELLSKPRKASPKQMENEEYLDLIMGYMTTEGRTVSDIQKAIPQFADFSTQKVAALVKLLIERGSLQRETVKGRSYFSVKGN